MPKLTLPSTAVVLSLMLVACSSGAASPSAPPGESSGDPSSTVAPAGGDTDHPTGATDVILRMEESGGFVPVEVAAGGAPMFTLYGDGRVVFQQRVETFPEAGPDGITRPNPFRTAQLDEGQIEELLTFALSQGGLGTARDSYIDTGTIDSANTIFTVDAGGLDKTVTVSAIDLEPTGHADDAARAALKKLADRLRDFDAGGTIASDEFVPSGYRALLFEREVDPAFPGPSPAPWPWPDLAIADFAVGDGTTAPTFPHRALTAAEVAALNVGDALGGASGMFVEGPDGKLYSVILRPLLPDEVE